MAYQLIYTSYSSSLVQGRTGFSTVARCEKMSERLILEVERASQYDITSGVVYAHRIVDAGGKFHILTRTKDCGVDYTNRNNYIAHHLIFSEEEAAQISANPAEILLSYSQWYDSFFGEPRYLDEIPFTRLYKNQVLTLPAETWREKFGDCAYAAILGETSTIRASVGDAKTLLRLYAEALKLRCHAGKDWDVTFTTQMLTSDKPSEFAWRARENFGSEIPDVDLIDGKIGALPTGKLAEYARTGILSNAERYNLSVSNRLFKGRKFNVVSTLQTSYAPAFIGLGIGVVILVAAVVGYIMFSSYESKTEGMPVNESVTPSQLQTVKPAVAEKLSLSKVISQAREKIDAGDFVGALDYWKSQSYASSHKQYEVALKSDISAKISSMVRYAENVSLNPNASDVERKKALSNLDIIEKSGSFVDEKSRSNISAKISELRRILSSKK